MGRGEFDEIGVGRRWTGAITGEDHADCVGEAVAFEVGVDGTR